MKNHISLLSLSLSLLLAISATAAENWHQWRGPESNGHSTATNVPVKWTADSLAWKTTIPGIGQSTPVMWGNRIYLTSASPDGNQRHVFCIDRTSGEILADLQCFRGNCTRATATVDSIFTRGYRHTGTQRIRLDDQQVISSRIGLMRPACQDGVVVAHGQLYWGPWMCDCNLSLVGVISLAARGDLAVEAAARALAANPQCPIVPYLAAAGGPYIQPLLLQLVPRLQSIEAGQALQRAVPPFPQVSSLLARVVPGMR